MNDNSFIAPMELSIGSIVYSIRKQRDDEGSIDYTWYDVVTTRVKSLILAKDETHIIINKGFEDEMQVKQDDEEQFLVNKKDAVTIAEDKNSAEQAKIARIIENAKQAYGWYESLQEKIDKGEVYKH